MGPYIFIWRDRPGEGSRNVSHQQQTTLTHKQITDTPGFKPFTIFNTYMGTVELNSSEVSPMTSMCL